MRRVQMTVGLAVIVVSALMFVGCRSMTGRSVGQQFDDKVISTQVKTKLTTDRAANLFSTGVGTQFGIVRLTGTVQTPEQRAEAERIASNVAGVRGVKNEILVVPKDEGMRTANASTRPTNHPAAAGAAAGGAAAGAAATSPPPSASPTTTPLALSGEVTAINPTSGDVTVKTDSGSDVILRVPSSTASQLEQGQRISINAGTK
jgi:hyperosmotically inducible periplasmic protein